MTKSEKTVRALEDQFYGRTVIDCDNQIQKSLKKADNKADKKKGAKRPPNRDNTTLTKFKHTSSSIYKGYEMPKAKGKKNQPSTRNQDNATSDSKLSFAENLKNLLANQNVQNKDYKDQDKKEAKMLANKPLKEDSAQSKQHLYMRHYRPSGPIKPSDFLEDLRISKENFRKSQEQSHQMNQ